MRSEPDCDYRGDLTRFRSWFYFRVRGFDEGTHVDMSLCDISILHSLVDAYYSRMKSAR